MLLRPRALERGVGAPRCANRPMLARQRNVECGHLTLMYFPTRLAGIARRTGREPGKVFPVADDPYTEHGPGALSHMGRRDLGLGRRTRGSPGLLDWGQERRGSARRTDEPAAAHAAPRPLSRGTIAEAPDQSRAVSTSARAPGPATRQGAA
jgi:hypothetical protein